MKKLFCPQCGSQLELSRQGHIKKNKVQKFGVRMECKKKTGSRPCRFVLVKHGKSKGDAVYKLREALRRRRDNK